MMDFDVRLENFRTGCEEVVNRTPPHPVRIEASTGKRYVKLIRVDDRCNDRSVYAFVDTTNGDVLMPASWRAPAKHARGNIFNEDNGLGCVGPYGIAYLRG